MTPFPQRKFFHPGLGCVLWACLSCGSLASEQPNPEDARKSDEETVEVSTGERAEAISQAEEADEGSVQRAPKPAENVVLSEPVVTPSENDAESATANSPEDAVESTGVSAASSKDPVDAESSIEAVAAEGAADPIAESAMSSAGSEPVEGQRALVLLDTEVPPGTTTRLAWSPEVSFMGVSAPTPVLVVNGVNPGPTLCLTAAIHGDETNGIETVRRVLYSIDAEKLSGAVLGVPIVNLEGFRTGSRYLPDRRDLNRFFPGNRTGSAASRIAFSFFQEIISQCDMLVDLHTGSFRRTNLQQLRADLASPEIKELTEKMGRIVVVQSRPAAGTLRRAATERGIPAVTLEAGAPNVLDREVIEASVNIIENAMNGLGLLNTRKWRWRSDAPVFYESAWVRASDGGFLISETKLGANVAAGELLGVVTNPITNQRSEILSPSDGRIIGMAMNQFMRPGYAAYHLGMRPEVAALADSDGIADDLMDSAQVDEDPEDDAASEEQDGDLVSANGDDDPESGR